MTSLAPCGGIAQGGGSSAAAPFVTGAAALMLTGSVGHNGKNDKADVLAAKTRLNQLGYNWVTVDEKMDNATIAAIKLFQ